MTRREKWNYLKALGSADPIFLGEVETLKAQLLATGIDIESDPVLKESWNACLSSNTEITGFSNCVTQNVMSGQSGNEYIKNQIEFQRRMSRYTAFVNEVNKFLSVKDVTVPSY